MKRAVFAITVVCWMLIGSCKKTETNNNNAGGSAGGTWTFKSITYQSPAGDTSTSSMSLVAIAPGSKFPELAVDFYLNFPGSAGTLTVINGINTIGNNNQVQVGIKDVNGVNYYSTGLGNTNLSVTVNGGKLSITGTGIQLVNYGNPADTANLTFTLNQTN